MQPPASIKALGDPIYEAFYGLKEQPFAITTDPKFFYLAASHQRAFSELLNGLRRREGVLLVTGETGAGKTTLCRAVIEALGDRTFAAMILNPYMTGAEVLRIVLRDFGLVSHEDLRRGALASADIPQLLDTLEGFLQSLAPLGSHAVIVLDEAQSVPPQTLDQLRLLTALELGGQRLVQVVLCGQPGLLTTLKAEALSALNERITRRVELAPLPADQVDAYIQHRLGVAGGAEAVSFEPAAARMIADLSRGVPRRINVLCDRSLQEGRIEGVSSITAALVKRAARALAGAHEPMTAAPTAPPQPVKVGPPVTVTPPVITPTATRPSTPAVSAPPAAPTLAAPPSVPPIGAGADAPLTPAITPDRIENTEMVVAEAMAPVRTPILTSAESVGAGTKESETTSLAGGLTFGQIAEDQTASRWWPRLAIAAVIVAAIATAGYFAYARSVPDPASTIGPAPAPAPLPLSEPAAALPVPAPIEPEPVPATSVPSATEPPPAAPVRVEPPPVRAEPAPTQPSPLAPAPSP